MILQALLEAVLTLSHKSSKTAFDYLDCKVKTLSASSQKPLLGTWLHTRHYFVTSLAIWLYKVSLNLTFSDLIVC